jgi:hypothetical protein
MISLPIGRLPYDDGDGASTYDEIDVVSFLVYVDYHLFPR